MRRYAQWAHQYFPRLLPERLAYATVLDPQPTERSLDRLASPILFVVRSRSYSLVFFGFSILADVVGRLITARPRKHTDRAMNGF